MSTQFAAENMIDHDVLSELPVSRERERKAPCEDFTLSQEFDPRFSDGHGGAYDHTSLSNVCAVLETSSSTSVNAAARSDAMRRTAAGTKTSCTSCSN